MKLTTQQIQHIIKEELNLILYEAKGISVISLPTKIINALRSKKLEPLDYARINHLFKLLSKGDESESDFANKWIKSLYKDFPEFKKIVDNDIVLKTKMTVGSLSYADLRGVNFSGVNLRGADLSGASLFEADLSDADLSKANLSNASLTEVNLSGVNLRGANLREANLIYADLSGANLRRADLSSADLYGTNLRGADLIRADLSDADLRGALYNSITRWPEGFDPIKAGAKKV